jgi:hypothetical protein
MLGKIEGGYENQQYNKDGYAECRKWRIAEKKKSEYDRYDRSKIFVWQEGRDFLF